MNGEMNRRDFIVGTSAVAASIATQRSGRAANATFLEETRVISQLPHRYHGWPTLARGANDELFVVCSGGREKHVCPFGRVELMRSHDGGISWSWPETVFDGPIDDRDAGVVVTAKGTLLVTTFTSLAYEDLLRNAVTDGDWDAERLARWQAAHHRVDEDQRKAALGVWMKRSTDNGVTWTGRYDSLVNSPHGPIQLSDGRLLYAGKELYSSTSRVGVCESLDDGKSWHPLAEIPTRPGDDPNAYHELHAVEAADGRLVVQIRNHNSRNARETLQTVSTDQGRSWSDPESIGVWGLPSHLLRLKDGRLLMTYGHRRDPLGNQARVSDDHGKTWSAPIMISADGSSGDLGYPSTVQRDDGVLVTVWYERLSTTPFAQLRQAVWQLSD